VGDFPTNARLSATAALFSLVVDVVLTNILLQSLLLMLYLGHLGFLVLFLLLFLDPEYLERQPMVQPHKAIASASPMSHVPVVPRTHRHDDKKGWQQEEEQQRKAVVVGNTGGLVSPAGSSRYLLTGRFAATEEIQEVESAPAVDGKPKREEAGEAADAKSA
jgi:hypothetical protein